ncbi:MAG: POT family MFS transporter [Verrucomicrobiae bacterium]|nr:POT family MFS transporter [Verrucomicrobiae bacterium]MDW7980716.1 POT family MFS transporter [Verrucomicrobiales bacterium]
MHEQNGTASENRLPTDAPRERWPRQVRYILGNEAAERFSYYGMKGILALYITNVLLKTKDQATNIIHLFTFANYFMPLFGAWVSDRFWGRYRTILWISLAYCVGHGVMALSDAIQTLDGKALALYIGLGLIAFGSGGIKPCVSAFMGDQFKPEQRHLLQKAYAAFYWMINLGSTAAFLIIPWIRKNYGYSLAFGVPGLAMAFATFIFWLGTKHYVMVPPSRQTNTAGFFRVFSYAFMNRRRRNPGQSFWDVARERFSDAEVDAAKSVGPILSIFAFAPIFWSLFDQTFSTWVLQGAQMVPYKLGNYTIGPEEMLSANPILVMIFVPVMTWWVYPLLGRLATPLRRMSAGMFLGAVSFVVVAMMQARLEAGEKLSVLWQIVPYVIITIAEVLFSTTGLEFAFREAAPSMKSTIMGFWSLTVALGNLFVSVLTKVLAAAGGAHDAAVSTHRFLLYAGMTFVVAIGFSVVASFYRYRDDAAAHGR